MLEHAKTYCSKIEKIENFEKAKLDNFKGWHCHHRFETHNSDGQERLVFISSKELKALDMYYNRPPEELIFMSSYEHLKLHNSDSHNSMFGKKASEESIRKGVETRMNNGSYKHSKETIKKIVMKNRGKKRSDETKRKQSEAHKKYSSEISKRFSSCIWVNNGIINKRVSPDNIPEGFIIGRTKGGSSSLKGRTWTFQDGRRVWK